MNSKFTIALLLTVSQFYISEAKCIFQKPVNIIETNIGNVISWNTAEEIDNARFIIEKSTSGIEFTAIGEVNGAGTTNLETKYRFLDNAIGNTVTMYRLTHIDGKGEKGSTPVFVVKRKTDNNFTITGMSSLKTDATLSITIRSSIEENMQYKIIDMNHKVVENQLAQIIDGANILTIDTQNLPMGDYILHLSMKNENEEILFRKVNKDEVPKLSYIVKE